MGFVFTNAKCLFGIQLLFKKGIFRSYATFKETLANSLFNYKTESNTLRSYFEEDQMVFTEYQLSKLPYGKLCFHCRHGCKNSKRVSTTFECILCKMDCWNSHLTADSPKKRRREKMVIKIIYSKSRVSHSRRLGWGHLEMFLKPLIKINAPHGVPPLKNEGPPHLKNKSPVEK